MKFIITFFLFLAGTNAYAEIINYQVEGSLESPSPATCVRIEQISNRQNPVDIFHGVAECIAKREYELGSRLYMLGMAYGLYDTLRVEDRTAHQAIIVVKGNVFSQIPEERIDAFQMALDSTSQDKAACCRSIKSLGKPEYHPRYMIQHGMGAFLGGSKSADGLVNGFEPEGAWDEVLTDYLQCSL